MRDLYALRCFVIVAEELHMTRAAQRLQIAQPNLTRIIRRLEEEVECVLFDRNSKRHLVLTPAGHAFQAPLRVVLPVGHPLARLEAIPLAELSKEPWVWLPRHVYPRLYKR